VLLGGADGQRGQHPLRVLLHYAGQAVGQVFALFALAITVAEVAVGLALVLLLYRTYGESRIDTAQEMKG
jgi:NADH-quinone oxidoreductase subunit K